MPLEQKESEISGYAKTYNVNIEVLFCLHQSGALKFYK